MTRPMPGPPECLPTGFPHDGAAINAPGCLLHARSYHANSKRLKDSECADEHRRACQDHALAEKYKRFSFSVRPERSDDPDRFGIHRKFLDAATWHRFAHTPHALDAT